MAQRTKFLGSIIINCRDKRSSKRREFREIFHGERRRKSILRSMDGRRISLFLIASPMACDFIGPFDIGEWSWPLCKLLSSSIFSPQFSWHPTQFLAHSPARFLFPAITQWSIGMSFLPRRFGSVLRMCRKTNL